MTYLVLLGLAKVGLIWDLQRPPASVLAGPLVEDRDQPELKECVNA